MKRIIYNIKFMWKWVTYHHASLTDRRIYLNKLSNLEYATRNFLSYNEFKRDFYEFQNQEDLDKLNKKIFIENKKERDKMLSGYEKSKELATALSDLYRAEQELAELKAKNRSMMVGSSRG